MSITRSKPFYAVAGAGDLAVRTLREAPGRLSGLVDPKDVASTLDTLQAGARTLPARAQTAAVVVAGGVADTTDAVYGELVARGRRIVTRVRRQQASRELREQTGTTVRRTRTATRVARDGASDTRSAVKASTTTARKRAASTAKATKSAGTAARRTARTAGKATGAASSKVGT
jgi:hypothetical protein